jgi:D-alanine-D-alanine ligase
MVQMQRITILLLFGGESSEHTVSLSSARNVFAAIDDTKYDVVLGYIDRQGTWWLVDMIGDSVDQDTSQLLPLLGQGSLRASLTHEVITPAVIVPILHGANGEDGTVQGLARLLHIPIVGCDMQSSVICMDKHVTKQLLDHSGIKTVPYVVHMNDQPRPSYGHLSVQLGSPLFVKPARSGSSVGVSKVINDEQLSNALTDAHQHDDKVLIERAITARELEVAVLGSGANIRVSGVGEIKPDREFYSYESKYDGASQTQVVIPAEMPDDINQLIVSTARTVYQVLGCSGLARIDFFLSDDNTVYVNEINTIPGFTNISMYPKLWRASGVGYSALIEILINDALEK